MSSRQSMILTSKSSKSMVTIASKLSFEHEFPRKSRSKLKVLQKSHVKVATRVKDIQSPDFCVV